MNPDGDKNQNNLNGVPNADPTQQAIFTPVQAPAPEPPRPAQNSSVVVGSVVEPVSTGLSHQYYSNHPTKTSASGIGDIVIGWTAKTKNKKFFIPIIISLGFTVLAITVAIVLSLSQQHKKLEQNLSANFNSFANIVLYDNDGSGTLGGAYNKTDEYKIYSLVNSNPEEQDSFFLKIQTASDKVRVILGKTNINKNTNDNILNTVGTIQSWAFLATFGSPIDGIAKAYDDAGDDEALKTAENLYAPLLKSDNERLKNIGEKLLEAQVLRIELFSQMHKQGCKVSELDDDCSILAAELEEKSPLFNQINNVVLDAQKVAAELMTDAIPELWVISKNLSQEK